MRAKWLLAYILLLLVVLSGCNNGNTADNKSTPLYTIDVTDRDNDYYQSISSILAQKINADEALVQSMEFFISSKNISIIYLNLITEGSLSKIELRPDLITITKTDDIVDDPGKYPTLKLLCEKVNQLDFTELTLKIHDPDNYVFVYGGLAEGDSLKSDMPIAINDQGETTWLSQSDSNDTIEATDYLRFYLAGPEGGAVILVKDK